MLPKRLDLGDGLPTRWATKSMNGTDHYEKQCGELPAYYLEFVDSK